MQERQWRTCQDERVRPLRLVETRSGWFRLELIAGTTDVDAAIVEVGHEPNGPFWEGIAQLLIRTQAPHLDGRFFFDSEAGTFCANSQDRDALDELAALLRVTATDPNRIRNLVASADASTFRFDD